MSLFGPEIPGPAKAAGRGPSPGGRPGPLSAGALGAALLAGALLLPLSAPAAEPHLGYSGDPVETPGVDAPFAPRLTAVRGDEATSFRLTGSGVRRQLMFKVYAAAVYAEVGADLSEPARALAEGDFAVHLVLRFLRDTAGNKVVDAYEKGFDRVLDEDVPDALLADKDALLGHFSDGIRSGETIEFTCVPGRGLDVFVEGEPLPSIPNEALARAIRRIYLGDDPVSDDLKRDLVRLVRILIPVATHITEACIDCGACEPECPNGAISPGDGIYVIEPDLCTECVGFHEEEMCQAVCPVACCLPDPRRPETEAQLLEKAKRIHPHVRFGPDFPSRFRRGD